MKNEPLIIKKRGEDGTKIITVRIKEDTLTKIDRLAAEVNYSRNELINVILSHGIKNIEIEWIPLLAVYNFLWNKGALLWKEENLPQMREVL